MRDFKGMKRQRGRNRGGGGSSGGNTKPTQNANRAFDSNGPEGVKVRGNAQHVFEKYQQLARDANAAGDRVLAENYLQHAEHYFRLIRAIQPSRPPSDIIGRDQFASGYDIDFEDESGQPQGEPFDAAPAEPSPEARQDGERGQWQARDDRQRDDRPRDERPRDDRPRDDRPREERPREERVRAEGDEPRRERFDRDRDRPERDPLPIVQPQGDPAPTGPMLRDSDGGASHAPAFLQARPIPAPAPEAGEEKPKRRRRAPRSFEAGEGPPPSETEEA